MICVQEPTERPLMARASKTGKGEAGFTIAELLVVLVIIALLAAVAVPNVTGAIRRAEEAALRENLSVMRGALDDYFTDKGSYPAALDDLVSEKYLRSIPEDPVADDDSGWWLIRGGGGIEDITSVSNEVGSDDRPYSDW